MSSSGFHAGPRTPGRCSTPSARAFSSCQSPAFISWPSGCRQLTSFCARSACRAPFRNVSRRRPGACLRSDEQLPHERGQPARRVGEIPVDPADLVVLAVGVVVAALRAIQLVARQQHRHALREEQRGQHVAHLAAAQRDDAPVVGRTFDAAVPADGCGCGRRGSLRGWPRCAVVVRRPCRAA